MHRIAIATRLLCAAAALAAAGAARADTVTFGIDAGFSTCSIFDSGALDYAPSTSCGRVTGTITLNRGPSAGATSVAAVDLESWLPGDWGRAARYTYNVAGEDQDGVIFTTSLIQITTTDIFTAPADHVAAGINTWTASENTVLTLSYSAGVVAGQPEFVFGMQEQYGANQYYYNPYFLRAEDPAPDLAPLIGGAGGGAYFVGNMRGAQSTPLATAAEVSATADVPAPAALPLLALGLGALGLARRRRRG